MEVWSCVTGTVEKKSFTLNKMKIIRIVLGSEGPSPELPPTPLHPVLSCSENWKINFKVFFTFNLFSFLFHLPNALAESEPVLLLCFLLNMFYVFNFNLIFFYY